MLNRWIQQKITSTQPASHRFLGTYTPSIHETCRSAQVLSVLTWASGQQVDFTKWLATEPTRSTCYQHCLTINEWLNPTVRRIILVDLMSFVKLSFGEMSDKSFISSTSKMCLSSCESGCCDAVSASFQEEEEHRKWYSLCPAKALCAMTEKHIQLCPC